MRRITAARPIRSPALALHLPRADRDVLAGGHRHRAGGQPSGPRQQNLGLSSAARSHADDQAGGRDDPVVRPQNRGPKPADPADEMILPMRCHMCLPSFCADRGDPSASISVELPVSWVVSKQPTISGVPSTGVDVAPGTTLLSSRRPHAGEIRPNATREAHRRCHARTQSSSSSWSPSVLRAPRIEAPSAFSGPSPSCNRVSNIGKETLRVVAS